MSDCAAVLCHGMGWRAAQALHKGGIQAFLLPEEMTPEQAVKRYLAGDWQPSEPFCHRHR